VAALRDSGKSYLSKIKRTSLLWLCVYDVVTEVFSFWAVHNFSSIIWFCQVHDCTSSVSKFIATFTWSSLFGLTIHSCCSPYYSTSLGCSLQYLVLLAEQCSTVPSAANNDHETIKYLPTVSLISIQTCEKGPVLLSSTTLSAAFAFTTFAPVFHVRRFRFFIGDQNFIFSDSLLQQIIIIIIINIYKALIAKVLSAEYKDI